MLPTPIVLPFPGTSASTNDYRHFVIDAQSGAACVATFKRVGLFETDDAGGFIATALGDNDLWGYINQHGKWLIEPIFKQARTFSEDGLARVQLDNLWGYINKKCVQVITPQFTDAGAFSCGLAPVCLKANQWYFIDVDGAVAIAGPFAYAKTFSPCGLAAATKKLRQKVGYINRKGEWQIEPTFSSSMAFSADGVAGASEEKLYGLIDMQGNWILKPTYSNIHEFNDDGLAFYDEVDSWDNGHGYMDTKGNLVFKGERHLSNTMVKGIAKAEHTGSRYFTKAGANLSEEYFSWGEHFSQFSVGIVRTRDTITWRTDTKPHNYPTNRWGLLNTEGAFNLLSDSLLEPFTNSDGWVLGFRHETPLAPFITHDGAIAYVSASGALEYRLTFDDASASMMLRDQNNNVLWQSAAGALKAKPRLFFNPTPSSFADDPRCLDDNVVALAQEMLLEVEARVASFIAGEKFVEPENADDDDDDDDENEVVKALTVRRRIVRAYLDENHYSHYDFMYTLHGNVVSEMQDNMRTKLNAHFGPSDPDPETPAIDRYASPDLHAWCVALQKPLNKSVNALAEDNQQWLALYRHDDTGDGDAWHELWLVAAPSVDAAAVANAAAQALAAAPVSIDGGDDAADETENNDVEPTTSEGWLAKVVGNKYALQEVPATLMSDAIADAAVAADTEAFQYLPAAHQSRDRLLALVRKDAYTAVHIPPKCMTLEALTLARQLWESDGDWAYKDDRNKLQIDEKWDHNSLYDVWGAHLDEALCIKAIKADVGLRNIPLWLRNDKLDKLAIEKDICNISELAPEKITAEMAERAVRETYSNLIQYIPPALQTEALCIKSAKAHGASLEFIPQHLRTVAVCVAALKQERGAFIHVPDAIQLEVVEALIAHAQAKPDDDGEKNGGTYWHYPRAWIKLHHLEDAQGALNDATLAIPHTRYAVYAHYLRAAALRALGRDREAALEAAVVLSMSDDFTDEFSNEIDTSWLSTSLKTGFDETTDAQLLAEMQTRPLALASVPRNRITPQMIDVAVAADIEAVQFVPKRLMTPALYAMAVKSRNKRFSSIPAHMLSEAACIEEVQNSGYSLRNIPDQFRTVAVCTAAVADNESALEYTPEAIKAEVQQQLSNMPFAPDDDGEPKKSSWMERQLLDSLMADDRDKPSKKALQKLSFFAIIFGGVAKGAFKPSTDPATLPGPLGWLERRPIVAVFLNAFLGFIALGLHVWVTVAAWRTEGAWAGLATGILMGFSELYWAWRFLFQTPLHLSLGLACLFVIFYTLIYRSMHMKVAVAFAKKAQDDD